MQNNIDKKLWYCIEHLSVNTPNGINTPFPVIIPCWIYPPEILDRFLAVLGRKGVPSAQYVYYRKRLRYYLDFCRKYRLEPASAESHLYSKPSCAKKSKQSRKSGRQLKQ